MDRQLADLLTKGRLETQRQKLFQSKVDQLQYQIDFIERKMENIKDEIAMLDSDDVEEKKDLKSQWKRCKDEKKSIFDKWTEVTQAENTRREGVEVEWDASKGAFDNATCLTMESSLALQPKKGSPSKPAASAEKLSTQKDGSEPNASSSTTSQTVAITNLQKKKIE